MTITNNSSYFKPLGPKVMLNKENCEEVYNTDIENPLTQSTTANIEAKPAMSSSDALAILNGETDSTPEVNSTGRLTEKEALAQGYTIIDNIYDFQCLDHDGKYILMCDLDFSNITIESLGGRGTAFQFHGEINGNGYTIKNLNIEGEGLFSSSFNATFKNLVFDNINVNASTQYGAGILSGNCNNDTFENIIIKNSTVNGAGGKYAGALAADLHDSICKNIRIENTEVLNAEIAGLLAGHGDDTIVENLYLQGTVDCQNASDNSMAGGVFGELNKSSYLGAGSPPNMFYFYDENHDIYKNVDVTIKNATRTHTYFGSEAKFIDEIGYSLEEVIEQSKKIAKEKGYKPTVYPHIYTFVDEENGSYSTITFNWSQGQHYLGGTTLPLTGSMFYALEYTIFTGYGDEEDLSKFLSINTSDIDITIQKAVEKGFERVVWTDQQTPLFIKDNKFYIYNKNGDNFEEVNPKDYNIEALIPKPSSNSTTTSTSENPPQPTVVTTNSTIDKSEKEENNSKLTINSLYSEANILAEKKGFKQTSTFGVYEKDGKEYEYDIYDMRFILRTKKESQQTKKDSPKTLLEIYISAKILADSLDYKPTILFGVYEDSEGQRWEYNVEKDVFEKTN